MSETQQPGDNAGVDTNIKPGIPPLAPLAAAQAPLVYRAVSGWAIAGFALGSMFALLVVLCALISFYQGAPFFLYGWLVGVPLLGVFVSLYGHRHVRVAEGTLAGAKLAQWGFRFSLVSGLMYCAYYFVTEYAVCSQANAFVMEEGEDSGFFPRLQKGDNPIELNRAFLLTQPPNARAGRPDNEASMLKNHDIGMEGKSGFLTQFRESQVLPRILYKQLGKDAEITPKGVQKWDYEKRSYVVERIYHIKTKEVEVDYLLVVQSAEAESAGGVRKWFVNLTRSGPLPGTERFTPTGEGIALLRQRAGAFLAEKILKLEDTTTERLDFKALDQTPWEAFAPKDHKDRRERIAKAFAADIGFERTVGFQIVAQTDPPGKWEQVGGKVRLYPMIRFVLGRVMGQPAPHQLEAIVELETVQAIDPATYTQGAPVDWKIRSLSITAMTVPDDSKRPSMKK